MTSYFREGKLTINRALSEVARAKKASSQTKHAKNTLGVSHNIKKAQNSVVPQNFYLLYFR